MKTCKCICLCALLLLCRGAALGQDRAGAVKQVPVREALRWSDYRAKRLTRHFAIYTDLKESDLDYYEAVFEGFFEFFEREYFAVPAKDLLTMYLFSDLGSYGRYVKATTSAPTSYGYYLPDENLIVINLASGLGTATHELVHYFVRTAMPRQISALVNEGFAAFFEKFIGHLDEQDRLHLTVGYFSNWRFPVTKKNVDMLSLQSLMASANVDQCAARAFMLYLHREGKLKAFITAYHSAPNDVSGKDALERAMGLPLDRIEANWKQWIRATPLDANVFLVERAFILPHDQWAKWQATHRKTIRWNEQKKIYEAVTRRQ